LKFKIQGKSCGIRAWRVLLANARLNHTDAWIISVP
jgi:hypothetical protein